jgi:hypothetical protein
VSTPSEAERFFQLLRGDGTSHGTYSVAEERSDSLKLEIKATARTVREPPTVALWEKHLAGERSLGIVPIREDDTCVWGAVDVDVYTVDHAAIQKQLDSVQVPGIVCRTKSGGAHVYMFFSEAIPAKTLMMRLRELASLLGYGDSEVFPKQTTIMRDKGDLGSWLNMPYFGGDRYAVRADGRGLSAGGFLTRAEASRITLEQLMLLPLRQTVAEFSDGPPCLEALAGIGFTQGMQNNGMFALGTLAKKMRPDDWEPLLEQWNRDYMRPPIPQTNFAQVVKSVKRKDYNYRCNDQPIVSFCNVSLCRTRKFGVGMQGGAPSLSAISYMKTDPPVFFVSLKSGGTVECGPEALMESRKFQLAVFSQIQETMPLYETDVWLRMLSKLMEGAVVIEAPREVSVGGHFEELLEQFCTDRHAADVREDVLLGKPWTDPSGKTWFRIRDLEAHLVRAKFDFPRTKIATAIRDLGGGNTQVDIRGKNTRMWFIPPGQLSWQTVPHDIPETDESPL